MLSDAIIKLLAVARDFLGLGKKDKKKGAGRKRVYSDQQLQLAELSMRIFGIKSERELIREMKKDSTLRKFTKLKRVPSQSTLSRRRRKTGVDAKNLFYGLVRRTKELLNWICNKFSVDSKLFWAHSNRNKKTDKDAKWGYCAAKEIYVFGYKVHIISETSSELPVAFMITPANGADNEAFLFLFRDLGKNFSYEIKKMIADCGYDDIRIRKILRARFIDECISKNGRRKGKKFSEKPKDPDYKLRSVSERVNSRIDEFFGLPNLKLRGIGNVVYHVSMVLSSMLFLAITSKINGGSLCRTLNQLEENATKRF